MPSVLINHLFKILELRSNNSFNYDVLVWGCFCQIYPTEISDELFPLISGIYLFLFIHF